MSETRRYFDAVAEGYQERSAAGWWALSRALERRALLAALRGRALGSVLDLGSGSGYYGRLLLAAGSSGVVCVDLSAEMLAQMGGLPIRRLQGDLEDVPLDEKFDTIVCAGALEFVGRPARVFERVARWLQPGGLFVLLAPRRSVAGRLYRRYHARHGVEVRLFSWAEIEAMAAAAGLTPRSRRVVPPFSWCVALHR